MNIDKTEELIEIVRHYPILYDTSHDEYKDGRLKNKIWESIAESLQEHDGDIPKSRWKNLKDSYSKHLRAAKGETSTYIDRYRYWPWVEPMSFMQPFIEGMPTRANRGVRKRKLLKDTQKATDDSQKTTETEELMPIPKIKGENTESECEDPIFVITQPAPEPQPQPEIAQYYIKNDVSTNSMSNMNTADYDETDLIFLGYSKLIKKLSRRQQAAVKFKIAKVIMEAELEGEPPTKKKSKLSNDEHKSDDNS
ncbi:transcription factor Adf-1-like [Ostrinia nubilalis]|uniref:transcription factor Adf-1-like n=1 Tax=Ostrinia furnacalis TaxID=93504 RepID=UPI001040909A|nr:transcription factor Adf-1-like [Ostrinia furnacalis]